MHSDPICSKALNADARKIAAHRLISSAVKFYLPLLGGIAAIMLAACGTIGPVPGRAFEPEFARALNATATEAAVAKPGVTVCRQMQVGIAERDWIRGVVSQIHDGKVTVRIDDAGRFPHELNGITLKRGAIVSDTATAWTPCL